MLALFVAVVGAPGLGALGRAGLAEIAVALAAGFLVIERGAAAPLVDFSALSSRGVAAAYLAALFALLTMSGGMSLSVIYAGLLADASPRTVGLLLTPPRGGGARRAPRAPHAPAAE